jgi:biopolymer transport protein ExbB
MSEGAARPDELAVGISEALITTCMGLILALPLLFCHNYLRNRVTGIGQRASGFCEQLLRIMTVALEAKQAARSHGAAPSALPGAAAPTPAQIAAARLG